MLENQSMVDNLMIESRLNGIVDALHLAIPKHFSHVYATVWLDLEFSRDLDWRIESSTSAQKKFL